MSRGTTLLGEHPLHLAGDTGQAGDERRADRHHHPRRRADRVGQRVGADRQKRLDAVPVGHRPVPASEKGLDRRERRGILGQFDPGQPREDVAGQVILSWAQAAAGDHDIRALDGDPKGDDVFVHVVADRSMKVDRNPEHPQLLAEPLAVGVERLAADQFGADGDDLRFHPRTSPGSWCRQHRVQSYRKTGPGSARDRQRIRKIGKTRRVFGATWHASVGYVLIGRHSRILGSSPNIALI